MSKQNEDIIKLLSEIRDSIDSLHLRVDEVENNMFELTEPISDGIKRIIKKADIKKKRKKSESGPTPPDDEWPLIDAGDLIQESDQ